MTGSPIGQLRAIGKIEGVSFLVLLGIAMPLKYLAGVPNAVKVVGWIHGVLFMVFCALLLQVKRAKGWSAREAGVYFLAALLPFGPFVVDGRLKREDR
jgi:integral membrane protein